MFVSEFHGFHLLVLHLEFFQQSLHVFRVQVFGRLAPVSRVDFHVFLLDIGVCGQIAVCPLVHLFENLVQDLHHPLLRLFLQWVFADHRQHVQRFPLLFFLRLSHQHLLFELLIVDQLFAVSYLFQTVLDTPFDHLFDVRDRRVERLAFLRFVDHF